MEKRRLGKTDIQVTPIGLGCWQFSQKANLIGRVWDSVGIEAITSVVDTALKGGINWFDTAEIYGNGRSEENLAAALVKLGVKPGSVVVATKWFPLFRSAGSIGSTIGTRLAKLSPYPIDLYQVHQPFSFSSVPAQMREMAKILRAGKIRSVGVSNFNVARMEAAHAALAAQIVGLDVAGLDVVANDISQRLEDQGGVVVEVNAGPGLAMHLTPSVGAPRPVGEAIVDTLFPPGENGRIPLVCVTGTNGKTTVTRLVAHILRSAGRVVGMTSSDGIDVSGRTIESGDCAGPRSARKILLNPQVEAAVFEAARGGILREGLGFDRCDVAVVTNIGQADHLGLHNVNSVDDMFTVKRTPVDVVLPTGCAVLNASDPLVAQMARIVHDEWKPAEFYAEMSATANANLKPMGFGDLAGSSPLMSGTVNVPPFK